MSSMHYVSLVLTYCISEDALYISGFGVVCVCDRPIDSCVINSCADSVSKLPVVDTPYVWI